MTRLCTWGLLVLSTIVWPIVTHNSSLLSSYDLSNASTQTLNLTASNPGLGINQSTLEIREHFRIEYIPFFDDRSGILPIRACYKILVTRLLHEATQSFHGRSRAFQVRTNEIVLTGRGSRTQSNFPGDIERAFLMWGLVDTLRYRVDYGEERTGLTNLFWRDEHIGILKLELPDYLSVEASQGNRTFTTNDTMDAAKITSNASTSINAIYSANEDQFGFKLQWGIGLIDSQFFIPLADMALRSAPWSIMDRLQGDEHLVYEITGQVSRVAIMIDDRGRTAEPHLTWGLVKIMLGQALDAAPAQGFIGSLILDITYTSVSRGVPSTISVGRLMLGLTNGGNSFGVEDSSIQTS